MNSSNIRTNNPSEESAHFMLKLHFLIVLTLLFFHFQSFSQTKSIKEEASSEIQPFFPNTHNDSDFYVTEIPSKWQKESVVIICNEITHEYTRINNRAAHRTLFKTRLKLNDKKAVNDFSVFYYPYSKNPIFGIRIIKTDNSTINVDLTESVDAGINETPIFFESIKQYGYKKIAIPNLQPGDILDYYYMIEEKFVFGVSYFKKKPHQYILPSIYPIVKQKFNVRVGPEYHVILRAFNTKNKVQEGPMETSNIDPSYPIRTFNFEERDLTPIQHEYWQNLALEIPTIKLRVHDIHENNDCRCLTSEGNATLQPFDLSLIQSKTIKRLTEFSGKYSAKRAKEIMSTLDESSPDTVIANEVFYFLRNWWLTETLKNSLNAQQTLNQPLTTEGRFDIEMSKILTKLGVKHKFIIAATRNSGGLDNVAFKEELVEGIKVGSHFYFSRTNLITHDYIPENILGSEAIEFECQLPYKLKVLPEYQKITIPKKSYADNFTKKTLTVTIDSDFDLLTLNIRSEYSGLSKDDYSLLAVSDFDYTKANSTEELNALSSSNLDKNSRISKAKRAEINYQEKLKDKKINSFIKIQEQNFEIESYKGIKLISVGREENTPDLIYEEEFVVNDLLGKAGRNYMLKVGALIGKQLELKQDDMDREFDIHINYAKGYQNIINITIPEGYTVDGVSNLNTNIVNEMGEFKVAATFENNILSLDVKKLYKTQDAKPEDWPGYVAFLEETFNFTQKKVILKKISN